MKKQKRKTQKELGKKIAGYSALAASFLAIDNGLNAQVECGTVGALLTPTNLQLPIDFDGDGTSDIVIVNFTGTPGIAAAQAGSSYGGANNPNGNFIQGFAAGAYNYAAQVSSGGTIGAGSLGSNVRADMWFNAGYANSQWTPGTTGWLGAQVLLDCNGDGDLTNDTPVFAALQMTIDAVTADIIIGDAIYDCSGAPFSPAAALAACAIPTIGQWAQMCLALFFMSTGVIYLNRKEEEFEEEAA